MASIAKMTPNKGKVGNTAVMHGSELTGNLFEVRFGRAQATDAVNPGNSSENIKCTVPNRNAQDPSPVNVTVKIDGVAVELPPEGLKFEYNVPLPEAEIREVTGIVYGTDLKLAVTLNGLNFVNSQREPDTDNIFLVDVNGRLRTVKGAILAGFTETRIQAEFSGVRPGTFYVVAGFSDGAGATSPSFEVKLA